MAKIPKSNHTIANLIDEHHASQPDEPRLHLGGSIAGHPCERWLWLSFRWAAREAFPGRIRRLFRRGHNEESWIVDDLRAIGVEIHQTGDNQKFIDFGGHIGGTVDGIIERGVPGAEKSRHIAEFKTHARKSFDDVTKLLARAKRIATSERIPPPLSTDASWYQCKFCAAHSFCHTKQLTKHVNCRTCAHATPEDDNSWSCARWESKNIPGDFQKTGCDSHVLHPDMVPWPIKDSNDPHEAVYEINGKDIRNGEGDAYVYSSKDIIAGGEACADELVEEVKKTFLGANIVEVREKTNGMD